MHAQESWGEVEKILICQSHLVIGQNRCGYRKSVRFGNLNSLNKETLLDPLGVLHLTPGLQGSLTTASWHSPTWPSVCGPHTQWTNGLPLAWRWTGLGWNMEQELWWLALLLALLKPQLCFFYDWKGALEMQKCNLTEINITHPPVGVSEKLLFFLKYCKNPLPAHSGKEDSPISPVTLTQINNWAYHWRIWTCRGCSESASKVTFAFLFFLCD